MVPIYSIVAWLCIYFYRKNVYFQVLGDCYEAFTISAFFALLCHYIAPDLHMQKEYFRGIKPKPWLWPLTWLAKCCGGDRGCWRTPRSGLTWFNVRNGCWNYRIYIVFGISRLMLIHLSHPDYLDGYFSILSSARAHDYRCCHYGSSRYILRGVSESGLLTCLGMIPRNRLRQILLKHNANFVPFRYCALNLFVSLSQCTA